MANISTSNKSSGIVRVYDMFKQFTSPTNPMVGQVVSLESVKLSCGDTVDINSSEAQRGHAGLESLINTLDAEYSALGLGSASNENMQLQVGRGATQAQLTAAAIMINALSSLDAARSYFSRAMTTSVQPGLENAQVVYPTSHTAYGYSLTDTPALEAFDNRVVNEFRALNVLLAFSSAVQDPASELFYRTVTLTPDNAGLQVTVSRTVVMNEVRHPQTGAPLDWNRRNLLDAISDPSILANNATKIYPRVIVGNVESEKYFTDKAKIAPKEILANGDIKIMSAPLRPGVKVNLIGISQNDKTNGQSDETDSLDHRITIENLYFEIKTTDGTSIIKYPTKGLSRNGFLKSNEGQSREVVLTFTLRDLVLSGATKQIDGNPATALEFLRNGALANTEVRFGSLVSGTGNLQYGYINVNANTPELEANGVRNFDPVTGHFTTVTDEKVIKDIESKFTEFTLIGYDVNANRSNMNNRQLGLLIDNETEEVRFVIPVSSPITVKTPIKDIPTATDLSAPINAQRLLNSINANTKTLEVLETLRSVVRQVNYDSPTATLPNIEGFARTVVRPYLYDSVLNVSDVVTNIASSTRTKDVMATIVNKLRFAVTKAYTESRYQPALDAITGAIGERPTVAVVTDPTTAAYLAIEGDWRTVIGFDVKVEVTYDVRFRGKIAASFVRTNVNDVDILSFGCMGYVPEITTKAAITYNQTTVDVITVQNRTLHVCMLPILIWIEVEGLEAAASDQTSFDVSLT